MKNGSCVSFTIDLKRLREQFSRLACRVQKEMNPDEIHDLRVLTRRLRAMVWISGHSRRGLGLKRLKRTLRDLGHALGEKRTLDVLQQDATRYRIKDKVQASDLKSAQKKVLVLLSRKKRSELDQLLLNAESKLKKLKSRDIETAVAEIIVRLKELQRFRPKNPKEWHLLRIEVKKLRYASELLGVKASELKKVQDLLGRGHDLGELMDRFGGQRKVHSDVRKLWSQAKKLAPSALNKSEERFLACRK